VIAMSHPLLAFSAFLLLAPSLQQADTPPPPTAIPGEAVHMVNPVKATSESQARVKKIYGYDCAMCHGATGDGKGEVVADLKLNLKDLTDPATQKDYTDGELFYIIKNGKGQMTAEGDRLKTDEVWNMVILVRSMARKTTSTEQAGSPGSTQPPAPPR
jgi:mono/diheme cytochrome c family protein